MLLCVDASWPRYAESTHPTSDIVVANMKVPFAMDYTSPAVFVELLESPLSLIQNAKCTLCGGIRHKGREYKSLFDEVVASSFDATN